MADLPLTISIDDVRPAGRASRSSTSLQSAVPLTMPAVLLHDNKPKQRSSSGLAAAATAARKSDAPSRKAVEGGPIARIRGGKRRRRRTENAQLSNNPHVQRPSKRDFLSPGLEPVDNPVFAPPPREFHRSLYVPPAESNGTASRTSASAAGQFKMGLKGLRRTVRSMTGPTKGDGGRTEELLDLMESEIRHWLAQSGAIPFGYYHSSSTGKVLDPTPVEDWNRQGVSMADRARMSGPQSLSTPITLDTSVCPPSLTELTRSPSTLVWLMPSPHARFLLHVLARFYSLQSFSRPLSPLEPNVRITHISRPHMVQPRPGIDLGFETPPGTDWSDIGATTGEGTSESEIAPTDADLGDADDDDHTDDAISEASWEDVDRGREGFVDVEPGRLVDTAVVEEASDLSADDEVDNDVAVDTLADSMAELPMSGPSDTEATPSANRTASALPFVSSPFSLEPAATTPQPLRARLPRASFPPSRTRQARAQSFDSSRSRSPVRTAPLDDRQLRTTGNPVNWKMPEQTFVDYLFA